MEKPEIFNANFDNYLEEFERYNHIMEFSLIKEFKKRKQDWDIENKEIDKVINISNNIYEHVTFYPQIFRNSLLVQIFSVYEIELKKICLYHHFTKNTIFSIKDLKGNSDIEKSKLYLEKACKIDIKTLNPELEFLDSVRVIRNLIVHSQGYINQNHNDFNSIFSFIQSNKNLIGFSNIYGDLNKEKFNKIYDKNDYVFIEIHGFLMINELIKTLRSYFFKLTVELKKS